MGRNSIIRIVSELLLKVTPCSHASASHAHKTPATALHAHVSHDPTKQVYGPHCPMFYLASLHVMPHMFRIRAFLLSMGLVLVLLLRVRLLHASQWLTLPHGSSFRIDPTSK